MSNIFEQLAPLSETQSHIALLKDLYKKVNKIK